MNITFTDVFQALGAAALAFAGWVWRENASLRADLAAHKTHVAETYVTKVDNERAQDRIYAALERIEKKLDERH